jgi:flagellar basal body rod protein FlgG
MKSFRTIFARDLDSASFKGENQGLPAGGATVQTTTVMGDALEGYLDLTSQQLQLTGSNMANIDTPAYKTLAFNFESEFTSLGTAVEPAIRQCDELNPHRFLVDPEQQRSVCSRHG